MRIELTNHELEEAYNTSSHVLLSMEAPCNTKEETLRTLLEINEETDKIHIEQNEKGMVIDIEESVLVTILNLYGTYIPLIISHLVAMKHIAEQFMEDYMEYDKSLRKEEPTNE